MHVIGYCGLILSFSWWGGSNNWNLQYCTSLGTELIYLIAQLWTRSIENELQHDTGPYRTVRIALYMFTHVIQVNVFLAVGYIY